MVALKTETGIRSRAHSCDDMDSIAQSIQLSTHTKSAELTGAAPDVGSSGATCTVGELCCAHLLLFADLPSPAVITIGRTTLQCLAVSGVETGKLRELERSPVGRQVSRMQRSVTVHKLGTRNSTYLFVILNVLGDVFGRSAGPEPSAFNQITHSCSNRLVTH